MLSLKHTIDLGAHAVREDRRASKILLFDPSINLGRASIASSNDGAGFDSSARPVPGHQAGTINEEDEDEEDREASYYGDSADDDWSDRGGRSGGEDGEEEKDSERVMDIPTDDPTTPGASPSPGPDGSQVRRSRYGAGNLGKATQVFAASDGPSGAGVNPLDKQMLPSGDTAGAKRAKRKRLGQAASSDAVAIAPRTSAQAQLGGEPDGPTISRVKFYWRTTFIFRSDGHLDYIGSNNTVYSTRNLDFEAMEYKDGPAPASSEAGRKAPVIKDAVCEEGDLLLITARDEVFLFNTDRLMLSKTKIKAEQARLSPYQDRVQLFPQFLVYDNILMIGHAHILSVFDMNARVSKEKSWRHLVPPLEASYPVEGSDVPLPVEEILQDPFKQCSFHIRMMKMREHAGLELPRVVVMFENNLIRTLTRDTEMKWQYEAFQRRSIPGTVMEVIASVKSSSLMLLRHKAKANSSKSSLAMFYFKDAADQTRWNVLDDLEDHQRVF